MIASILILAATLASQPKVETFPAPAGHVPTEIARQGNVMTVVSWKNWPAIEPHLARVDAKGKFEVIALEKDYLPGLIAPAADGSLWLSDGRQTVLWHVHPDGRAEKLEIGRTTLGIAIDPSGKIWTTHPEATDISTFGADGTQQALRDAGRTHYETPKFKPQTTRPGMTVQGAKEVQKRNRRDVRPSWIAAAPDGTMWFSEPASEAVGRISLDGRLQRFKLPAAWGAPKRIIAARDALWFAVTNTPVLGRITPEGEITGIDIPAPAETLAVDAKGRIWFSAGPDLGYLAPDGSVQKVPLPKAPSRAIHSMAAGPDNTMWFVDQKSKTIGKVALP